MIVYMMYNTINDHHRHSYHRQSSTSFIWSSNIMHQHHYHAYIYYILAILALEKSSFPLHLCPDETGVHLCVRCATGGTTMIMSTMSHANALGARDGAGHGKQMKSRERQRQASASHADTIGVRKG